MNIGLIKRKIYYLIKRKIYRNTMADAVENTKMEKLISLFKKLLNRGKCKIAEYLWYWRPTSNKNCIIVVGVVLEN